MKTVLSHPRIAARAKISKWVVAEALSLCLSYGIQILDFALALLCDAEAVCDVNGVLLGVDPLQEEADLIAHVGDALLDLVTSFAVAGCEKIAATRRGNLISILNSRKAAVAFLRSQFKTSNCPNDKNDVLAHFVGSHFEYFLAVATHRSKVRASSFTSCLSEIDGC